MRIAIASDHAAVELRETVAANLRHLGHQVIDLGVPLGQKADYPDQAAAVGCAVVRGEAERGVLLCGSGIGVSMAANKIAGIRAALVHDETTARLSREHNDANVLCLGARTTGPLVALQCVEVWLGATFDQRHQRRVDLLANLDRKRAAAAGD
ncbi:MAG: ribose 5-phosphate isomerase B [Myxococcales bacterium]|nr:ribose 5-phosphate isomerase B [Myxococcales bacterium]